MPNTTIDWCEANYVVHPSIAEFFNTATSLLAVFPLCFWFVVSRPPQNSEGSVLHYFYLLGAIIFAGSTAFHATLTWAGQLLDEVPILIMGSASFSVLFDNWNLIGPDTRRYPRITPWLLFCMCVLQAILIVYAYTMRLKIYEMFLIPVVIQVVLHWPFLIYELTVKGRSGDINVKRMLAQHLLLGYGGWWILCCSG